MIGLAVSMGTCSLSVTPQGDQAVAAEPSTDPQTSNVSNSSNSIETAAVFATDEAEPSVRADVAAIKHTVQEGQTLWDVARFYSTHVSAIAAANNLSLTTVLQVGQVLTIPTDVRLAQATSNGSSTPGYYGLVSGQQSAPAIATPTPSEADAVLKEKQHQAVENLKQKRESLRLSLSALNRRAPESPSSARTVTVEPSNETVTAVTGRAAAAGTTSFLAAQSNATAGDQAVAFRPSGQFSQPATATPGFITHRVSPGETLGTIARMHGISTRQLIQANRITDPNYILVGQTLQIPQQHRDSLNQQQFNGAIAAVPSTTVTDVPLTSMQPQRATLPVSGNTTGALAAVPFTATPQSVSQPTEVNDSGSRLLQYNHVESLKLEIERLRQRYQDQPTRSSQITSSEVNAVNPAVVERAPSVSVTTEPVNPEFNPDRYSARLREMRDRLRSNPVQATVSTPAVRAPQPQLVATAPLGSENYDPIKSRLGRTVSPELPSLGTGSEFLPGAPGQLEGYIWPTKGVLTSPYGWRWGRMHKGVDIAGPVGTPIVAAADGVVTYAGWNSGGYGYLVEVQHPDGSLTLYAHNNRVLVQVGQQVAQGQQISEMGSTGYSTGPHLHFEIHPSGKGAVNPMAYLPRG